MSSTAHFACEIWHSLPRLAPFAFTPPLLRRCAPVCPVLAAIGFCSPLSEVGQGALWLDTRPDLQSRGFELAIKGDSAFSSAFLAGSLPFCFEQSSSSWDFPQPQPPPSSRPSPHRFRFSSFSFSLLRHPLFPRRQILSPPYHPASPSTVHLASQSIDTCTRPLADAFPSHITSSEVSFPFALVLSTTHTSFIFPLSLTSL